MSKTQFDIEHVLKLEAVFQNPLAGFIIMDKSAKIESVNKILAREIKKEPGELEGQSLYKLLNNENKTIIEDYLHYCIHQKQEQEPPETIGIKIHIPEKKDKYIKLVFFGTQINNQLYFIGIVKDITPEKKLESKLKEEEKRKEQYKENLEKEKAVADLKTRFVSMASHEFRSPIAGMLTSVNLMEKYIHSAHKEWEKFTYRNHIEKHIHVLRKALGNLQYILNEFLSMGKLDSGKLKVHIQTFNLGEFLKNYENQVEEILKPEQALTFHCKNCDIDVQLDKNFLHNILNNLISNAMKYSAKDTSIDVSFLVSDENILLIVEDEGKGIPEKHQARIFDHFYRADNVKNYNGTGLGLTITKKYVELMHGNINFESEEGKGTKFIITFPLNLSFKKA